MQGCLGAMLQAGFPRCITRYSCLLGGDLVQGLLMTGSRRNKKSKQGGCPEGLGVNVREDKGLTDRPCRCLTGWVDSCHQTLQ